MTENKKNIPVIAEEVVIEQEQQIVGTKEVQNTNNWVDLGEFFVDRYAGIFGTSKNEYAIFRLVKDKFVEKDLGLGNNVRVTAIMINLEKAKSLGLFDDGIMTLFGRVLRQKYKVKVKKSTYELTTFDGHIPIEHRPYYVVIHKGEDLIMEKI